MNSIAKIVLFFCVMKPAYLINLKKLNKKLSCDHFLRLKKQKNFCTPSAFQSKLCEV